MNKNKLYLKIKRISFLLLLSLLFSFSQTIIYNGLKIDNNLYAGHPGDCPGEGGQNNNNGNNETDTVDPTFLHTPIRILDLNYEKPLFDLKNSSVNKILVTYDKNLIQNNAKLIIGSSVPSWLTISGLDNKIDYDNETLGAIEITASISGGNLPNTYTEIKLNLIDFPDTNVIDMKIIRVSIEKTLTAEISVPVMDSLARADVPIFGYAFDSVEGFASYRVKYGKGINPTNWIIITNSTEEQKFDNSTIELSDLSTNTASKHGNLATWKTGLTAYKSGEWPVDLNGIYTVRLEITDVNGNTIADEIVVQVGKVITQSGGGSSISPDEKMELFIPSFAIHSSFKLIAIDKAAHRFTKKLITTNLNFIGNIYEVRSPGYDFKLPVELKFYYTDNELDLNGDSFPDVDESDLAIFMWNTILSQWSYIGNNIDISNKTVTANIDEIIPYFAFYTLAENPFPPSAPILARPKSPTGLKNIVITGLSEPGTTVKIFLNNIMQNELLAEKTTGIFTAVITNLNIGTNIITAKSVDLKGRESIESPSVYVELILNPPSSISSIKFMDESYSHEITNKIYTGDILYIELIGNDSSFKTMDTSDIKVISTHTDPQGIKIQLIEIKRNSGIYRGTVRLNSESISYSNILAAGYEGETVRVASLNDITKKDELVVEDNILPLPPKISSPTHPSLAQNTFEIDFDQWANKGGEDGATLIKDDSTSKSGEYSLKLINKIEGGFFSSYVYKDSFNAKSFQEIEFDYKIPPDTKTDILIYINNEWLALQFTDEAHPPHRGVDTIHTLPVTADNQWQSIKFNIYEILKKSRPELDNYYIDEIVISDVDKGGCGSVAGGANKEGAFFHVDNFKIMRPYNNSDPIFNLESMWDGSGITDYSYILSTNKFAIPDTTGDGFSNTVKYSNIFDGYWYFHVRAKDGSGNWGNVNTYLIHIDSISPIVSNPSPTNNSVSGTNIITLKISDSSGSGILPDSIKFSVEDQIYAIDGTNINYSKSNEILIFKSSHLVFTNNQVINCSLIEALDLAGNSIDSPYTWEWTFSTGEDTTPPDRPIILVPVTNEITGSNVVLIWESYDLNGISDYSYILDTNVNTIPDATGEGAENTVSYSNLSNRRWYFHVRAKDNAGNLGKTTHFPLYINIPAQGEIYYVDNVIGSDDHDGLTRDTAFATIERAIYVCKDNLDNTIYVIPTSRSYSSVKYRGFKIEKSGKDIDNPLRIISYPTNMNKRAEIYCKNRTVGFSIKSQSFIFIEGFKIGSAMGFSIQLDDAESCIIKNNICYNNDIYGIRVNNFSENNHIISNICFENKRSGIVIKQASYNNIVSGNSSYNNGDHGIMIMDNCLNNIVNNNYCYLNKKNGITINYNCENNFIINNVSYSNERNGIYLQNYCNNNSVTNNNCYKNKKNGINIIYNCNNNLITANKSYKNIESGINLKWDTDHNYVIKNECYENKSYGICSDYYCNYNIISENIVYKNTEHGILLRKTSGNNYLIRNESFSNEENGIYLDGNCNYNSIASNI